MSPKTTEHWNGEGEQVLTFEVRIKSWGHREKIVTSVTKNLNTVLHSAFGENVEITPSCERTGSREG